MSVLISPQFDVALPSRQRRCYGAAVEAALAPVHSDLATQLRAPRLKELLSQLDADGHDTDALRRELALILLYVGLSPRPLRTGRQFFPDNASSVRTPHAD